MGLFSLKKKEQKPENLPPLKFPELPSMNQPEFPAPEQGLMKEADTIKRAVSPREEIRPAFAARPLPASMPSQEPLHETNHEQPLFIKVDKYKEVVDTLSTIKVKLADAGHILNELTRLKEEEDRELAAWHSDLSAIKEKLMLVDQKLFE